MSRVIEHPILRRRDRIFSVALILLVLINFHTLFEVDLRGLKSGLLTEGPTDVSGKQFSGLRPYLKNIHVAGYHSDYTPQATEFDIPFEYIFEQAKVALAPTILDRYHPGRHEYVIMYLYNPGAFSQILKWRDAKVIARINTHIILLKRL